MSNDYVPFAVGTGANTLTAAIYAKLAAVQSGFQAGPASSSQINTALRQVSVVASAVAQFVADTLNVDVVDDGNVVNLENLFEEAITKYANAPAQQSLVHGGADTGIANALVVAATPVITSLRPYMVLIVLPQSNAAAATAQSPATLQVTGGVNPVSANVLRADGSPVQKNDWMTNVITVFVCDGTSWRLATQVNNAATNGGLAKDANDNFLLAFLNLIADNRPAPVGADVIALERNADGATVSVSASAFGAYIASLFQQNTTFTQITETNQVGLSLAQTGDYAIPRGMLTTVPLSAVSVSEEFGSVSNGILTVNRTGFYLGTFAGTVFLASSGHASDRADLRFTITAGSGGNPLGNPVPIAAGGGQASIGFDTSFFFHLNANDTVYLQAYGQNDFNDAVNVGVSGYTNLTIAFLNS